MPLIIKQQGTTETEERKKDRSYSNIYGHENENE
jgi:hypothetical protein